MRALRRGRPGGWSMNGDEEFFDAVTGEQTETAQPAGAQPEPLGGEDEGGGCDSPWARLPVWGEGSALDHRRNKKWQLGFQSFGELP